MAEERNKSYKIRNSKRINTEINGDTYINVNLVQDYDTFEILSLKIGQDGVYKLHNADYGVIVGRVVANNGFGVPNCKVSVFISADTENNTAEMEYIYNYSSVASVGNDGIRYNLLPNKKNDSCHKAVGSFPVKRYLLDNDVELEVYDKYYTLTTRTNEAGDYMICGVPTGNQTIHMDCDLSDCGMLSQRPRDMVYKGYNINQFESANEFKSDTNIDSLKQILSQDQSVYVNPFWGNDELGETIGITRCDINLTYKFEPTCVFIGSVISDNASNGISKRCVPTNKMGAMDEMTTGEGRIEMIRKTMSGEIESFPIKGTQLIDGNGTWCYQIPMNLDYVMTDEYGKMVPTNDPSKGIPTRASVRFRFSMSDFEGNNDTYLRGKILVPHNPQDISVSESSLPNYRLEVSHEDYDYSFGSKTRDESFRDLFWNNVYTVKQYIPRFQYSSSYKNERFTGIKSCNHFGNNNPMPYNNIRIKMPLMFTILCALIKAYIRILGVINTIYYWLFRLVLVLNNLVVSGDQSSYVATILSMKLSSVADGICPDLENWYFTPITRAVSPDTLSKNVYMKNNQDAYKDINASGTVISGNTTVFGGEQGWKTLKNMYDTVQNDSYFIDTTETSEEKRYVYANLVGQTLAYLMSGSYNDEVKDSTSIDNGNEEQESKGICVTTNTDYLISCIEMNLAQEYRVINFDFYNDWINGVLYFPRWMMDYIPKKTYLFGAITVNAKRKGCLSDDNGFKLTRKYVQQCAIRYLDDDGDGIYTASNDFGCKPGKQRCHKGSGFLKRNIFGSNGGVIRPEETMLGETVYYYKPCEWSKKYYTSGSQRIRYESRKVNLFATDLVLLGSLNDCSQYGIPQAFRSMSSSSYKMPTNLALTNMDNDAYLYAKSDGSFCSGNDTSGINSSGVTLADNSYSGTKQYNSTLGGSDEYITYTPELKSEDYHDPYPLTESAGISWNYTGPGQGKLVEDYTNNKFYQPGGHFLGLSCTNSNTNLKSCINLQRICEMGASMSQRRSVLTDAKTDRFGKTTLSYNNFIPTGLISNFDITGASFRSMFATMNMKPLIADTMDKKIGYKKYSFIYESPTGFDGNLGNFINSPYNQKLYNRHLSSTIELKYATDDKKMLENAGFDIDSTEFGYEMEHTFAKTIEITNKYYYMFRLGLKDLNDEIFIKSRFYYYGEFYAMPQYQNSFYFYFGLKDGATAFDRFRSEFFSECSSDEDESN